MKAIFLLITLPDRRDTFRIALNNSVSVEGLTSANVLMGDNIKRNKCKCVLVLIEIREKENVLI